MTTIEQMTFDTIGEIQSMKRDGGKSPDFATMREVENSFRVEIKEAINQLVRAGLVEWHKDVNGNPMFGVKEQHN